MLAVWQWCAAGKGIEGADEVIPLRIAGLNIPADVMAKYPHLFGSTHLEIDPQHMHKVSQVRCWRDWDQPGL
jgi:hypothetical protein